MAEGGARDLALPGCPRPQASMLAMPRRVLAAAAVFAQLGRLHAQGSCPETCLFDGPMTSGDWVEERNLGSVGLDSLETEADEDSEAWILCGVCEESVDSDILGKICWPRAPARTGLFGDCG